jgi:serine/threonine-protein kinase HipA
MRLNELYLWFVADPAKPRYVGALNLVAAGKGVSLHYGPDWRASGFALSEDLPLTNTEFLPQGRLGADAPRAVGAVDDARPDRWGEKVIRFVDKPQRLSLMEYLALWVCLLQLSNMRPGLWGHCHGLRMRSN